MPVGGYSVGPGVGSFKDPPGVIQLTSLDGTETVLVANDGALLAQCTTAQIAGLAANGIVLTPIFGDNTARINFAIALLMAAGGGVLQFSAGYFLMLGAFEIPYTLTSGYPMQSPLIIKGDGANYGWNGSGFPQQTGGTIIDNRYGGGDSFGHVAKIDTRGMGTLIIEDVTLTDGGTSNFLFIQTTNTVIKIRDCRFVGNTANVGTSCVQDCIRLGGITSAAPTYQHTDNPLAGFYGYGGSIRNCQFENLRECVQFGSACNSFIVDTCTVTRQCGSSDTIGAPYHFYGVGAGPHGNQIFGGFIEMIYYPYGIAMIDIDHAVTYNTIDGLSFYDEDVGTPTLGGVYFDTTDTNNTVRPGEVDGPLRAAPFMTGPGEAQNSCDATGVGGITQWPFAILIGSSTGKTITTLGGGASASGDGYKFLFVNNGTTVGQIGNFSAVQGGAYDAHMTIRGNSHGVIFPTDNVSIMTGATPTELFDIGPGTGQQFIKINGGNTNTSDGSGIRFYAGGTIVGEVGIYSALLNGAYNDHMTLIGNASGNILMPNNSLSIMTGSGGGVGQLNVGSGTGYIREVLNGGHTATQDGGGYWVYNNSLPVHFFGNESSYLNAAYSTIGALSSTGGINFYTSTSVLRMSLLSAGRLLIGTASDDTSSLLQVAGNVLAVSIGNGATALKISGAGSFSANASVATVLGSVGPSGANTTVQEWLTIQNASGTTRYIPMF